MVKAAELEQEEGYKGCSNREAGHDMEDMKALGVAIFGKVDSDEELEFWLFAVAAGRRGLNVPALEGISVAMRPSGGTSSSALQSLIDILQVFM